MKKLFFVLPAALALLLCGCRAPADDAVDAQELKKSHQIEVIPAWETDAAATITDLQEIEDFVEVLDTSDWRPQSLPDGARALGSFRLSQEATRHPGETEHDDTLHPIATLTLYDGGLLELDMAGIGMGFSLPDTAAGSLAAYFW